MSKRGLAAVKADIDILKSGKYEVPLPKRNVKGAAKVLCADLDELREDILRRKIEYDEQIDNIDVTIAGVAHDLKTPIATISGYAECLQDGIDDKDYAALILEKSKAMNEQVVGMVEDLRQVKSGEKRRRVEMSAFLYGTVKSLESFVKSHDMEIEIKRLNKGYAYINEAEIARVLQNLVTNAVKASKPGQKIYVYGLVWGNRYVVRVKDFGKGIEKEDKAHVFDKFYMADKARKNGSGLGLYVSKELVESHGGIINFHSKPGKGTIFNFTLPIVTKDKEPTPTEKFEKLNFFLKLALVFFTGFIFPFVYRMVRFAETKSLSTLISAFLALPFFFMFWFVDFLSEFVYNKIKFFAD